MGKLPANLTRHYLDQYNVSGDYNAFDGDYAQENIDVTCFSDAGPRRLVGNYDVKASLLGFLDVADLANDEWVFALLGNAGDRYLAKVFANSIPATIPAEGSLVYDDIVRIVSTPRSAKLGGALMFNIETEGGGGSYRGKVLRSAAVTGTGNGTGQNLGATTAPQQLRVTYRVLAFVGTDITFTIQESSDNGGGDAYANVTGLAETFTAVGVATDSIIISSEAWKRVVISGTFTSATVLITIGVVKGTG